MTRIDVDRLSLLPRSFYEDDSAFVAPHLLGMLLVRRVGNELLVGRIVEVEAYRGFSDPAAHSFMGKTIRNAALFGEAGHAYVHAMRQYHLLDVVAETADRPSSVLIRALEPIDGIPLMQKLRETDDLLRLTTGPGRLGQALQINSSLNLVDLTDKTSPLYIASDGSRLTRSEIRQSTRIGITRGTDSMLRFFIDNNDFVSKR